MGDTLRERAARVIDHSWKFSWHWPERNWEAQALEQARERRRDMIRELADMENMIIELEDATQ